MSNPLPGPSLLSLRQELSLPPPNFLLLTSTVPHNSLFDFGEPKLSVSDTYRLRVKIFPLCHLPPPCEGSRDLGTQSAPCKLCPESQFQLPVLDHCPGQWLPKGENQGSQMRHWNRGPAPNAQGHLWTQGAQSHCGHHHLHRQVFANPSH